MILIISDVHGFYEVINDQVAHAEELTGKSIKQVVVLGDFGLYSDKLHRYFNRQKKTIHRPVYFIDGNHEEFERFPELLKDYSHHLTHFPRGTIQRLCEHNCLCLGGSSYIDGLNTPEAAEIKDHEIDLCLNFPADEVDIILTHDCPEGIGVPHSRGWDIQGPTGFSRGRELKNHFDPKLWLFGHHHKWFHKQVGGTRFVGLPISWEGYVILESGFRIQPVRNVVVPEQPFLKRRFWGLLGG